MWNKAHAKCKDRLQVLCSFCCLIFILSVQTSNKLYIHISGTQLMIFLAFPPLFLVYFLLHFIISIWIFYVIAEFCKQNHFRFFLKTLFIFFIYVLYLLSLTMHVIYPFSMPEHNAAWGVSTALFDVNLYVTMDCCESLVIGLFT